ncbi:MAG: antitoxin family protein [Acidobacteria bacterium]|nr:antitoxin family protein [Acidobacteriota bacterium]
MSKTFPAVYENGVLRPLEAVDLPEQQVLTLLVTASEDDSDLLDHELMARIDAMDLGEIPTHEEVRRILSKIPGSLADDIRAERDGRR